MFNFLTSLPEIELKFIFNIRTMPFHMTLQCNEDICGTGFLFRTQPLPLNTQPELQQFRAAYPRIAGNFRSIRSDIS